MPHDLVKSPRARRRAANLQRILETALAMVASDGLGALTMTRLAEAVDYTPGALYRYFDSKDALLSALVARILGEVHGFLLQARALLPDGAGPLAHVFALVHGYRAFARLRPHRFALLAMTMAESRVLLREATDAEPVARVVIATLQPLADALHDAERAALLQPGDVAERTVCVFALLQGVLQLHKQSRLAPEVLDVERLAVRGTRALLCGWGAQEAAVEAAMNVAAPVARSRHFGEPE